MQQRPPASHSQQRSPWAQSRATPTNESHYGSPAAHSNSPVTPLHSPTASAPSADHPPTDSTTVSHRPGPPDPPRAQFQILPSSAHHVPFSWVASRVSHSPVPSDAPEPCVPECSDPMHPSYTTHTPQTRLIYFSANASICIQHTHQSPGLENFEYFSVHALPCRRMDSRLDRIHCQNHPHKQLALLPRSSVPLPASNEFSPNCFTSSIKSPVTNSTCPCNPICCV